MGNPGEFRPRIRRRDPRALAALSAILLSARLDWHRRFADFALFGALGWSFGGSISYMQVVAYTHSGHSPSVLYGFACLFVIGFLWAALGGAGAAMPAVADRAVPLGPLPSHGRRLLPLVAARGGDRALAPATRVMISSGTTRTGWPRRWPWPAACSSGPFAYGSTALCGLIIAMAAGWWAGFAILVLILGLRMTPPRGDNWAGCLGMTLASLWYFRRIGLGEVTRGARLRVHRRDRIRPASMLKLVEVTSGYETNWHSILEQTTGLFNGIGLAIAMASVARWNPPRGDDWEPAHPPATQPFALGFVLLGITYLNLRKNVGESVRVKAVPPEMVGIATAPGSTWDTSSWR